MSPILQLTETAIDFSQPKNGLLPRDSQTGVSKNYRCHWAKFREELRVEEAAGVVGMAAKSQGGITTLAVVYLRQARLKQIHPKNSMCTFCVVT